MICGALIRIMIHIKRNKDSFDSVVANGPISCRKLVQSGAFWYLICLLRHTAN